MIPGTWLKHYITDSPTCPPMYFHFIGQLRDGQGERFIVECAWGQRMEVNAAFLSWLAPVGAEESPRIVRPRPVQDPVNKKLTGGKQEEPGAGKAVGATASISPAWQDATRTFPRLFQR